MNADVESPFQSEVEGDHIGLGIWDVKADSAWASKNVAPGNTLLLEPGCVGLHVQFVLRALLFECGTQCHIDSNETSKVKREELPRWHRRWFIVAHCDHNVCIERDQRTVGRIQD